MLLAAFQVLVDRGIAAASMDEIAQRAGVGKGTLYLYFRSKADMFDRLVAARLFCRPPFPPLSASHRRACRKGCTP